MKALFGVVCLCVLQILYTPLGDAGSAKKRTHPTPRYGQSEIVRSPSGELLERKVRRGGTVYVYDKAGRLLRIETVH